METLNFWNITQFVNKELYAKRILMYCSTGKLEATIEEKNLIHKCFIESFCSLPDFLIYKILQNVLFIVPLSEEVFYGNCINYENIEIKFTHIIQIKAYKIFKKEDPFYFGTRVILHEMFHYLVSIKNCRRYIERITGVYKKNFESNENFVTSATNIFIDSPKKVWIFPNLLQGS